MPTDDRHRQLYGLTVATIPDRPTGVGLGIHWYENFDEPDEAGFIGRGTQWGRIRGDHAIPIKPPDVIDNGAWWSYYDQGEEGACVGFMASRIATWANRRRYDAFWLYHEAQKIDEWPGEDYEGTSLRAGFDILRERGHRWVFGKTSHEEVLSEGILENRWTTSVDDILACIKDDGKRGYVVLCNSWGRHYPHYVKLPLESLDRLLRENGEAVVVTDRPGR
jgi:hypothetical protein